MIKVIIDDAARALSRMDDQSIHCCVTSPPYYGLRDYGAAGQIGLEETPEAYVSRLVEVFRQVRRVLRDDGTLWLNLGDSYAGSGRGGNSPAITGRGKDASKIGSKLPAGLHEPVRASGNIGRAWVAPPPGLKPKDLIGIPWRVAFALQADGWWLRQDIIWHKPNPMPESVTDRCTKAHEYVFLLAKSARYFYDIDSIKEPAVAGYNGSSFTKGKTWVAQSALSDVSKKERVERDTRNRRSVWTVKPKPYKGAHFATFPQDLVRPCILAGCPAGGTVLDPFAGTGTVGLVAAKHSRNSILIEINEANKILMESKLSEVAVFHDFLFEE